MHIGASPARAHRGLAVVALSLDLLAEASLAVNKLLVKESSLILAFGDSSESIEIQLK